jgi:hypothetical protein
MLHSRWLAASTLALWLAVPGGPVYATVVFSDTVLVKGPEYLTVLELPLDAIGNYKVTATDLEWLGAPLQALSFGVFTADHALGSLRGPGAFEFYKAGSDRVFLQIYARTTAPKYADLVGVVVEPSVSAVPLPPSVLLLVSGIGAAVLSGRLRRGNTSAANLRNFDDGEVTASHEM